MTTEGTDTTVGGTPQDREVAQDPTKEETALEEVEMQEGGITHAHAHLHRDIAQEDLHRDIAQEDLHRDIAQEDLHVTEKGTVHQAGTEVTETSVA